MTKVRYDKRDDEIEGIMGQMLVSAFYLKIVY